MSKTSRNKLVSVIVFCIWVLSVLGGYPERLGLESLKIVNKGLIDCSNDVGSCFLFASVADAATGQAPVINTIDNQQVGEGNILDFPISATDPEGRALTYTVSGLPSGAQMFEVPAFPGAEGYGAPVTGGRGGKIIKVTNLNASGPGSLQAALDTPGTKIIVFGVSGVINGNVTIKDSNVTIAGQTAPGAGITIAGRLVKQYSNWDLAENDPARKILQNIIIRFIRVRPRFVQYGNDSDAIQLGDVRGLVLDHVSASWGMDENIDLCASRDITVQWSTIEESDMPVGGHHNYGMIMGYEGKDASLHHNLFAHHYYRTPLSGLEVLDERNNVMYDIGGGVVFHPARMNRRRPNELFRFNLVNNYFKEGPSAPKNQDDPAYYDPVIIATASKPYMSGNYFHWITSNPFMDPGDALKAGIRGVIQFDFTETGGSRSSTVYPSAPVQTHSAEEAYDLVLAHSGVLPRDYVSARTIEDVRNGAGSFGKHEPPSGDLMYGMTPGNAPLDGDNDGMPNDWELVKGLNQSDAADAVKIVPLGVSENDRHAGYTYVEYYINSLADSLVASSLDSANISQNLKKLPGADFSRKPHFRWIPDYDQAGDYSVTITASDGEQSASRTFNITVSNYSRKPEIGVMFDKTIKEGDLLEFTLDAVDVDGDPLTIAASNLPPGASFNPETRSFSWIPAYGQAGTYNDVRFEVSDGNFVDAKEINITVSSAGSSYVATGVGLSNARYIDRDGDGYGVGAMAGPDADDNDSNVNTPASVINKYGTLTAYLAHRGYNPTRLFFISPAGDNVSGEVGNINKPFASFAGVRNLIKQGDAVIFRGGRYSAARHIEFYYLPGSATAPFIFMAYPGEKAILDTNDSAISLQQTSHVILDGLTIENSAYDNRGAGIGTYRFSGGIFRNMEIKNQASGYSSKTDVNNVIMENSVIHGMATSGIYMEAREPNINQETVLRGNLIYENKGSGIILRGKFSGPILENNVVHSNSEQGIWFRYGVNDALVRNNLIFNNNNYGIRLELSNPGLTSGFVLPGQNNNKFINNTVWVGKYRWYDGWTAADYYSAPPKYAAVYLEDAATIDVRGTLDNNVFRNNVLVSNLGPLLKFNVVDFADTTRFENNILFRTGGADNVLNYGSNIYNAEDFQKMSSLFANNAFADPFFKDISFEYWNRPETFNFDYKEGSPVRNFGLSTDAPQLDLKGRSRIGEVDAGCYEYPAIEELTILSAMLPSAQLEKPYSTQLAVSGGVAPYQWSIISGGLPSGLIFDSNTGIISGVATVAQSKSIIFSVTDSSSPKLKGQKMFVLMSQSEIPEPLPGKKYYLSDFIKLVTDWKKIIQGSSADVNLDGKVNTRDLGVMMSGWE